VIPRQTEAKLLRRNPWKLAAYASPAFLGLLFAIFGVSMGAPALAVFLIHGLVFGVFGFVHAVRRNVGASAAPTPVTVDDLGIRVGSELVVERARVRRGVVLQQGAKTVVRFDAGDRLSLPVDLEVPNVEEGRRVLEAMGHDVTQRAVSLSALSRFLTTAQWKLSLGMIAAFCVAVLPVWALGKHPMTFGISAALMGLVSLSLARIRTTVLVGADGVSVKWLTSKRTIPYSEVHGVSLRERRSGTKRQTGVEVVLDGGEVIWLPVSQAGARWDDGEASVLFEQLRAALDSYRARSTTDESVVLARGARSMGEWIRSLRRLGAGADVDMRTAPVSSESLLRILEDPSRSQVERAAAAVALSDGSGEPERARLRVAAKSTVSPKLRFAIEKAERGEVEDAELEQALTELEQDLRGQA
jgi:hypothetical protein